MIGKNNPNYGIKCSEEKREKLRNKSKGNTNRRGSKHKPESILLIKEKKKGSIPHNRKKIKINGVVYESIKAASILLNVSRDTIRNWIKKGKPNVILL